MVTTPNRLSTPSSQPSDKGLNNKHHSECTQKRGLSTLR